ncbi:MAG TPA: hypothetical protein VN764_08100 [Polyangiaceae bacterium]|nr:hypothetical protein [Polyangiaceae bacterium]
MTARAVLNFALSDVLAQKVRSLARSRPLARVDDVLSAGYDVSVCVLNEIFEVASETDFVRTVCKASLRIFLDCTPWNDNAHHLVLISRHEVPPSDASFPHARAGQRPSTRQGEAQLAQGQRPEQAGGWGLTVNWYDPTGFAGEGVEEEVIVHGGRYDGYTALPGYWDFGGPEPNLIFQSVPPNAEGDGGRNRGALVLHPARDVALVSLSVDYAGRDV